MTDAIRTLLLTEGRSTTELAKLSGLSQPTVSRRLRDMGEAVLAVGKARASRYFLRRTVSGHSHWPLYRIDESGKAALLTTLYSVYPAGYLSLSPDGSFECFESLPWWLADMRPQGFMGRALARQITATLHLAEDPRDWSDDEVLIALSTQPRDTFGNLLVGEKAYQQWLHDAPTPINKPALQGLAEQAMAGEPVGSSAAGEQPKFACYLDGEHCLVKFSAPLAKEQARRWGDLLVCEALALVVLDEAGLRSAHCHIIKQANRYFLASKRFDRCGALGRRGLISLAMLDAQFVGNATSHWPRLVAALARQNVVSEQAAIDASRAWCFGRLIANSDMHHGNISFLYDGQKPLSLAPIYDMLPMAFAPSRQGDMRDEPLVPVLSAEVAGEHWRWAWQPALAFWQRVSRDLRVSEPFRQLAIEQGAQLLTLKDALERMA